MRIIVCNPKKAVCHGGLVVKSCLQNRRLPGSNPDSIEDAPCTWAWCTLNLTMRVKRPPPGAVLKSEEGGASSGIVLVI
ncbi:hypothetical protein AVEN_52698-1 [Araneus ventricosus]|uniref:Uncharacterized protein n=1 Tax=Araneus ventricosus TaxID=182803 RepID=A0A4Y2EQY3_ARAVE|nr:hypothetical protein AVEN_52698-1 [Araneus ventricosus]